MTLTLNTLISILTVLNFYLLGTSRLRALIRVAALQGLLLGISPFITQSGMISLHTVILGVGGMALKGIAIPLLLFRALRGVETYREEKPIIGYSLSIAAGILMTVLSFRIVRLIPLTALFPFPSMISLAVSMAATGLFLIIGRTAVLSQIVGYLVLENAVYAFGVSLGANQTFIVEMGVLLDLLVGVIIMGSVIYHINRTFDSISTDSLEELKE